MRQTRLSALLVLLFARGAAAGFNEMARTPPLGWRSWNNFGCNVSQPDIEAAMRGLADTSRLVNGTPTSLLELGYKDVGLDDCWQELLAPGCRYPGSGAASAAVAAAAAAAAATAATQCTDPNVSFPVVVNTQCEGLAGPLPGVDTAAACAAACCADAACSGWQFCELGGCTGSAAPPKSCYTGALDSCGTEVGWEGRGVAQPLYTFHDNNGRPVVNTTRFPDLIAMTTLAHSLGLTAGWYGNNCFCHDHCSDLECFEGDVNALIDFGFDTVKYDGCSAEHNMTLWAELFAGTEKADGMVIENCNNDNRLIPAKGADLSKVPFHFYRSSTDIRPTYGSIASNGQSVLHLSSGSGPSCWAYPDMLEVGVTAQILTGPKAPAAPRAHWGETVALAPGSAEYEALAARAPLPPVLNFVESRAHFSMWTILSSPLTLSVNFSDAAIVDSVWPIITNTEAIAVNQAWAGSIGGLVFESQQTVVLQHCAWIWAGDPNCTLPIEQQIYKPLPDGAAAVLVMNHGEGALASPGVKLASVPGLACAPGPCHVRDVNAHADLGSVSDTLPVPTLASHDVFYVVLQ